MSADRTTLMRLQRAPTEATASADLVLLGVLRRHCHSRALKTSEKGALDSAFGALIGEAVSEVDTLAAAVSAVNIRASTNADSGASLPT